jgi:hypothetical protein
MRWRSKSFRIWSGDGNRTNPNEPNKGVTTRSAAQLESKWSQIEQDASEKQPQPLPKPQRDGPPKRFRNLRLRHPLGLKKEEADLAVGLSG